MKLFSILICVLGCSCAQNSITSMVCDISPEIIENITDEAIVLMSWEESKEELILHCISYIENQGIVNMMVENTVLSEGMKKNKSRGGGNVINIIYDMNLNKITRYNKFQ